MIVNPVPHSNSSDPSGGSAIHESGTGKMILLLSFLEGTDPIIFCSDSMIELFIAGRFFSCYRPSRFTDLKIQFGSGVFFNMDPFWADPSFLMLL